ncbi:MAG: SpoIIE family protein phosphatase, partial [Candidatus Latescibacteria bacterium]|nr:SpoIIE family protein phosphatase [Candidatus Latescibacterota bacterium]
IMLMFALLVVQTVRVVLRDRAHRIEVEAELQTAHDMQMSLMPNVSPDIEGIDIAGRCIPASQVGGDFFQYFDHSGKLSLGLADVTGHAMAAAIPVVLFNGVLESQMRRSDPIKLLFGELNDTLHNVLDSRTFVCFTMGELDLNTRVFSLSNGGCPYPYHYNAETGNIVELQIDAYPLGVRAATDYEVIDVQLQDGDYVVFCSDGIAEAENEAGEQFGYETTEATIRQACVDGLSAEATIDRILEGVDAFCGAALQGDDMTCVVVRIEETTERV